MIPESSGMNISLGSCLTPPELQLYMDMTKPSSRSPICTNSIYWHCTFVSRCRGGEKHLGAEVFRKTDETKQSLMYCTHHQASLVVYSSHLTSPQLTWVGNL